MKLKEFTYSSKKRKVLVLDEDESYIKGIDTSYLSDDEKRDLKKVCDAYNDKLTEFSKKAFRNFKKLEAKSLKEVEE